MAGVRPALGDSIVCNYTPTSLATIPLTGDILIIHCTRTSQLYKLTFYPTSRKYLYNFGRRHSSRSCKEVSRTLCWWWAYCNGRIRTCNLLYFVHPRHWSQPTNGIPFLWRVSHSPRCTI